MKTARALATEVCFAAEGAAMPSFRESTAVNDDPWDYSVPVWCAVMLLEGAAASVVGRPELLRRLGVPAQASCDEQWPVAMARFASVLRWTSRRTRDEFVGLWRRRAPPGTFSVVTRQMLHCATLGDALHLGLRLYRLIVPGFPLRLRVDGQQAWLELPAKAHARIAFSAAATYWALCTARWLVARHIPVNAASMSSPAPDPRYHEQRPFFEVPAAYGADATGVAFDARWLQRPLARTAAEVPGFLRAAPANLMRSIGEPPRATQQVRAQLELLLRRQATGILPSLDDIARRVGASPRALRRRLQLEGCHFLQLREDLLQEVATGWVAHTELPIAEISARLGFSEASAFHRAFKRWTGAAPGEYRR
jgi:AraC-like DNA-binding protein